jgi:5-methylcytosine-specific restriction endonuclease McrA
MKLIQCRDCAVEKPISEFNKDASKPDGVRRICRPCHQAQAKAYASERLEVYRARASAWYLNNKDRKRAYDQKWQPEYRKKTASQSRARVNARRRYLRAARPAWANTFFIREIYELAQLRTKATGILHEVDHIVPITHKLVCGLHCEQNMQIISSVANKTKLNRHWPNMP